MKKYWKDPEKSAETNIDGWLKSGGLGSLDADGYLAISGGLKDLIIRGGENISPVR
jgi:acyl-CoA synthetase (AMP-forming)/AMP-acid ligase II